MLHSIVSLVIVGCLVYSVYLQAQAQKQREQRLKEFQEKCENGYFSPLQSLQRKFRRWLQEDDRDSKDEKLRK